MTEAELSSLIREYEPLVRTVVRGVLPSRRDCEEAVADVFYSLWNSGFSPENPGAKTFIITLARRRAIDLLRAHGGEVAIVYESALEPDSPEPTNPDAPDLASEVEERLNREIIASVIRSLDPPDAEICTRRYYYNHRVKQIAAELGLKPSFVKSRLERAKTEIKRRLIERGINI